MDKIIRRDGLSLVAHIELPDKEKYPMVILMHGFTGDSGYHKDSNFPVLAEKLKENGFASLRFDFNGHGRSEGRLEDMNLLNELCDAISVLSYAREMNRVTEIFLLGHSQGGVIAGMTAGWYHEKIAGLVLLAPALILKKAAIEGSIQGVCFDPENVPDYLEVFTPESHRIGGSYIRTAQTAPIDEVMTRFKGQTCIVHGLNDEIVPYRVSEVLHESMTNSELYLLEDENHNMKKHPDRMMECVIRFLNEAEQTKGGNIC